MPNIHSINHTKKRACLNRFNVSVRDHVFLFHESDMKSKTSDLTNSKPFF